MAKIQKVDHDSFLPQVCLVRARSLCKISLPSPHLVSQIIHMSVDFKFLTTIISAVQSINRQKLHWTAACARTYEGRRVKDFALGFSPLSKTARHGYLLELMPARQTSLIPAIRNATSQTNTAPGTKATSPQTSRPGSSSLFSAATAASSSFDRKSSHALSTGLVSSLGQTAPAPFRRALISAPFPAPSNTQPTASPIAPPTTASTTGQPSVTAAQSPPDFTPPSAYDARDVYPGQAPCRAFEPLDQGQCSSCYAFSAAAAFSARLCRARPGSVGNVVVSPQELIDCSGGCSGSDVLSAYATLAARPIVELWCDPYKAAQQACGTTCAIGIEYTTQPGSVRQVGGAGAYGVRQMQLELVRGGPGVVSFLVMNDLFAYAGGVYSPSAAAIAVGSHAVSLVGWGVDQGLPYWLCQNSWGSGWGEGGFLRILRGADIGRIESSSGLLVIQPVVPAACPDSSCATGATTLRDCTCQCPFGRAGPTCAECALNCRNGGIADAGCVRCACPEGFYGRRCEGGYRAAPLAACDMDPPAHIEIVYSWSAGGASPPTQTSFVGVYALDETNPFRALATAALCGWTYNAAESSGLCPPDGATRLARPAAPGRYKIVVVPFSPKDARGLQG